MTNLELIQFLEWWLVLTCSSSLWCWPWGPNSTSSIVEEKSSLYAELKNEPKADSEPGQQSKGEEEKCSNADMLYVVVDKCL